MATANRLHDSEGDPEMQIAVLDSNGEDQTADEYHYGVVHVTGARIRRTEYT